MIIKYESISCPKCGSYICQSVVVNTLFYDSGPECVHVGYCIFCRHYYEIDPIGERLVDMGSVSIAR